MFKVSSRGTPNPDALKFVLTKRCWNRRPFNSITRRGTDRIRWLPLCFDHGVQSVFYMGPLCNAEQVTGHRWSSIQPDINKAISENAKPQTKWKREWTCGLFQKPPSNENNDLLDQINMVLDESVRPALAGDGRNSNPGT